MKVSQVRSKLIMGIILALFFGVALYLRVYFPYDKVFVGDWIKFTGNDAYYHMRLVDNLIHNFPHLFSFDPYLIYPDGGGIGNIRFFDWLLAGIIWVIGLGSPTEHTIDVVGVYYPAVLGALTVIPVYFIGRELFGRWAGVLSAGLIAILPGEFLGRSILGGTDHHVAETLFSTVAILFLMLAIKTASEMQLTFSHLKRREWATSLKHVINNLLAGIFLGVYIFTFLGALLFIFIIFVYFVIQFIIDHLRGKSTDYLCLVGVILFSVTLVASWLISAGILYLLSLIIALLVLPVLSGISRLMASEEVKSGDHLKGKSADYVGIAGVTLFFVILAVLMLKGLNLAFAITALLMIPVLTVIYAMMTSKKIKPAYYPLTLVGLGVAGLGLFYLVNPAYLSSMLSQFSVFNPTGATLTTIETQPFLFPGGNFTFRLAWGNFTTGSFLSVIALFILTICIVIKQGSADKTLLVVWSLVILVATLGQRRFAYYLAVNIALLTGYLSWQALRLVGLDELMVKAVKTPQKAQRGKPRPKRGDLPTIVRPVIVSLEVLIIFFVVFFWNIQPAIAVASAATYAPSDAWVSSLYWMKENTPEPFGNPDLYYQLEGSHNYRSRAWLEMNVPNPSGDPDFYSRLAEENQYPESAYGVVAWWDYGYWITRIAHRIPVANPSQDPEQIRKVASLFISQDEKSAEEIIGELDSSYVIIDYETATSKFWAIATWAGRKQTEFFDVYYLPQQNQMKLYIYPEYYRSLSTRLYNFEGKAVTPQSIPVISYQEKVSQEGIPYREITSEEEFKSYEEAEAYLLSQESGNYEIVGTDPFISPVPLAALEHYELIYGSEVKIFEYK